MTFCGQCGFQLPPGVARCPRCGAAIDTNINTVGELHTDDPTVASPSLRMGPPSSPSTVPGQLSQHGVPFAANNQQRLVLRPDSNNRDYNTQQQAYDATSRVDAPNYSTNTPAYPGYGTQGASNYQTQSAPPHYPTQSGGNYQTHNQAFPGTAQQGPYNYQQSAAPHRSNRGRTTGLILILLGLVFILGAIVLFTTYRHNPPNSGSGSINGTTSQSSSFQQAQTVIEQYYNDINKHDYTSAYALWQNNQQSLADFTRGYQNTLQDQLTFNQASQQADGAVKITVTVRATEKAANGGQQQSIYHINYVVAQQTDGSWKIMKGILVPS